MRVIIRLAVSAGKKGPKEKGRRLNSITIQSYIIYEGARIATSIFTPPSYDRHG